MPLSPSSFSYGWCGIRRDGDDLTADIACSNQDGLCNPFVIAEGDIPPDECWVYHLAAVRADSFALLAVVKMRCAHVYAQVLRYRRPAKKSSQSDA